jgi:hypothetical protein
MSINDLNIAIQNFNVVIELDKIVLNNEKDILQLNKDQLMQGIDSNSKGLREYRNPDYAEYKLSLNPAGVTDLKVTGEFHNRLKIDIEDYSISSTDEKNNKLATMYGSEIFGLTYSNMAAITDEKLTPQLTNVFQNAIK